MDIRGKFEIWLNDGKTKKYSTSVCIKNISEVSTYALTKKVSKLDLFEITNYLEFNDVRNKLLKNKMFRIAHSNTYKVFIESGKIFAEFLKQQKLNGTTEIINEESEALSFDQCKEKTKNERTIVDSIVQILKATSPLTSPEIYKEILANNLYSFGAKVPKSVVFTELMRHCENQVTYTITSKIKLFRILDEKEGQKRFALIDNMNSNDINTEKTIAAISDKATVRENMPTKDISEQEKNILTLLKTDFPRGIRLQFIDFMRLKTAYKEVYGIDSTFSDDELISLIKKSGIEVEPNKYSLMDNLLCDTSIEEIESFIENQNAIGAFRIWIKPLYEYFRDRLGDVVNAELLVKIILTKGKRKYKRDSYYDYFAYSELSLPGQREEMRQAVINMLKLEGTYLTLDELQSRFPAYPLLKSKKGLNLSNNPYIVELIDGAFAHVDCIYITEHEVNVIKEIVDKELDENNQVEIELVKNKLKQQVPSIFENNDSFNIYSIWKAVAFHLSKFFTFNDLQIRKKEDIA